MSTMIHIQIELNSSCDLEEVGRFAAGIKRSILVDYSTKDQEEKEYTDSETKEVKTIPFRAASIVFAHSNPVRVSIVEGH